MTTPEERAMQRAWCEYRGDEYIEGHVNPLPSDNFEKGYLMGRADALSGQWRSVDDELPPVDADVIARDSGYVYIAYFNEVVWTTVDGTYVRPTHWMPIPELNIPESK